MRPSSQASRLELLRKRLAAVQVDFALCVEELFAVLDGPAQRLRHLDSSVVRRRLLRTTPMRPFANPATFQIEWGDKRCFLGDSATFLLFDRLNRWPDHFISYDTLLRDVWRGARKSDDTIRSTVRNLKHKLAQAGMLDLASAIKGRGKHYGLLLAELR